MLALFRPLCWCFMPWLYSWLYIEALYHGFILGFILGFMSLVFQAAPCELNPFVQGVRYSGNAVPDASGELNPLVRARLAS